MLLVESGSNCSTPGGFSLGDGFIQSISFGGNCVGQPSVAMNSYDQITSCFCN